MFTFLVSRFQPAGQKANLASEICQKTFADPLRQLEAATGAICGLRAEGKEITGIATSLGR
jgi:hypothetical protein